MAVQHLDRLFHPRSIALYGVSADPRKLNGAPLSILRTVGFPGEIFLVNPKYDAIDGVRTYPAYEDLPGVPDVALVMVPAREVPSALAACGRKGTRAAVVISSGFEEAGEDDLVRQVREVCTNYDMALVGPNCEGVWSVRSRALLTFGSAARREELLHRPVAILSQSGAIAGSVARHLQDGGYGCAYVVSVGNETVLGILDYLEYLIQQDDVRVVLLFVEGIKQGERLLGLADRARERGITLVALKAGNSALGRDAAASHTGKIASAFEVYRDVFGQAGIIAVQGLVELIEAGEILSSLPLPRRTADAHAGVTVYSIPGGTRALTADLCEARGVPLAKFHRGTVEMLAAKLPRFGCAENPTDITGNILSSPDLFHDTLGIVASDPATEALVVQLANRGPQDAERYRATIDSIAAAGAPIVLSFLGDAVAASQRQSFAASGIACARDPSDAVRYLGWLYEARDAAVRPPRAMPAPAGGAPLACGGWGEVMAMLNDCAVPVARWALLRPRDGGVPDLAYPVAVKVLPSDAEHKTERGLLRLNVGSPEGVVTAAAELRRALGRADATLLVQEMVSDGVECVVAIRRDPDFGAVLALGSGGVMIELMRDVGHLCLPVDAADVERAIDRLKLARLLAGFRGAPPADRRALVAAIVELARRFPSLGVSEIELNPVMVLARGQGVRVVDVLVKP
jgi:acyl-CoA synthetase (NDP forming)